MEKRIVVTGIGLLTPFGDTKETLVATFSGKSAIKLLPKEFDIGTTKIGGLLEDFALERFFGQKTIVRKPSLKRSQRPSAFAHVATKQALSQAGLLNEEGELLSQLRTRTKILIGTGIGASEKLGDLEVGLHWIKAASTLEERIARKAKIDREHMDTAMTALPDTVSYQPSMTFGIQGGTGCLIQACATGASNIEVGALFIQSGVRDIVIAGGVEVLWPLKGKDAPYPLNIYPFTIYARTGALSKRNHDPQGASRPFDQEHDGFVPSEGAGVLVLEELNHAQARGAPILAELIGVADTSDAKGATDPDEEGQERAIREALEMAKIQPSDVDVISTHGTSTVAGDRVELETLKKIFGVNRRYAIYAIKSMLGHTLGASGAIAAGVMVEALQQDLVPPTINLINPIPEALICGNNHTHVEDCYLNIPRRATKTDLRIGVSLAFGFGGQNVVLVFEKW